MARAETETGSKLGVLLTMRGAPSTLGAVPAFLAAVTGQEPTPEKLHAATVRYLTIGGGSPAAFAAERIAAALERRLNGLPEAEAIEDDLRTIAVLGGESGRADGPLEILVQVGCLLTEPSIWNAVARLEDAGCTRIVHADLNPLEPDGAVRARRDAVRAVARAEVLDAAPVADSEPASRLFAESVIVAWENVAGFKRRLMVFAYSAGGGEAPGSVPARVLAVIDGLAKDLALPPADTAAVKKRLGVDAEGGAGDVTWAIVPVGDRAADGAGAGDRLIEVVEAAVEHGFDGIAVVPIGYTVDDDATLHLMDVLAADVALARDVEFSRARVPNDDSLLIEALDAAVRAVM
jgi:protoheme ferro-lyase